MLPRPVLEAGYLQVTGPIGTCCSRSARCGRCTRSARATPAHLQVLPGAAGALQVGTTQAGVVASALSGLARAITHTTLRHVT